MPLSPGVRVGPYDIQSPLGAGGMGEVYRARDTNLNREVALKILPEKFARDPERMARFQREAKALAALNHPHIAAIYSLEEFRSTRALALELVEGPTLAERLAETPLSVEDAVPIARQIAEALEYAHEQGIIHRDLKPSNIKINTEGKVKLLDFGLAKTLEPSRGDAAESLQEMMDTAPTRAASVTQTGVIIGTAAYMSPEQARGDTVDRRADIWSFGCVLYEMISGSRPFGGPTVSDVLAAVLRDEPDWQVLPAATPAPVRELLRRCLKKDPKQRLRDIGDARLVLDEMLTADERVIVSVTDTNARRKGSLRRVLPWSVAALLLLATVVLAAMMYRRTSDAPERAIVSEILHRTADGSPVRISQPRASPDGRRLAYVAPGPGGKSFLWVRSLDSLEDASPLKGTEGADDPFWAPDGRRIGFFAGRKLMRIEVTGGPPAEVTDITSGAGGVWTPDDIILFTSSSTSPIYRISANGGQPIPVTSLNTSRKETSHRWPQLLPDNNHFLYYVISSSSDLNGIYAGSLDGREPLLVLRAESRVFSVSSSHLLFVQDGALTARPFDHKRLEISGDPVTIARPREGESVLGVTASRTGMLLYLSGPTQSNQQLQWFDRNGTPGEIVVDKQAFFTPRISPDDTEVAVAVVRSPSTRDIWIYDLVQKQPRGRLTFDEFHNWTPVWSPAEYKGGRKLAFSTNPKGQYDVYLKSEDGTGVGQALLEDDAAEYVDSWCGNYIAYARGEQKTTPVWDIWVLPLFGDRNPVPFLHQTSFNREEPTLSRDCKWMAYVADEKGTGNGEVYVAPFPKGDGNWQISIGGGRQPRWRADGKELFYLAPGNMLTAAEIQVKGGSIEVGARQELFPTNSASFFRNYDVNADGSKFLIVMPSGQAGTSELTLIENWQALLQKK